MENLNYQDNDTNMEINEDVDESSDLEFDSDDEYGGAHIPTLDNKVYQKLKQNDPSVSDLHIPLNCTYGEPFFNSIDWKEDGDCVSDNAHLKMIRITCHGCPAYAGQQYVLGEESLNSGLLPTKQQLQEVFLCIYRNSFLKELAFSSIEINDEFGGGIIEGLSGHRSLEKLHVSNGLLGGMACKAIGNILTHPTSKLKDLDLLNCYLDNKNFGILCDALSGNSTMKRLNLTRNNRITSAGWQSLSALLQHPNCKLAKLSLKSTDLYDDSIAILGSSIGNSSLRALDLSFNRNISREGWQRLINQLSQNINIMSLGLIENSIDDLSVAALANIGNLKFLDLSFCNFFTPMGWWPFFNALQRRGIQLTKLDISGTNIGNEGAAALGSLLSNMSSLRTLQMSNMSISGHNFTSQRWQTLFTTLLDSNLDLVKLHLGGNQIDDEGIRLLALS